MYVLMYGYIKPYLGCWKNKQCMITSFKFTKEIKNAVETIFTGRNCRQTIKHELKERNCVKYHAKQNVHGCS